MSLYRNHFAPASGFLFDNGATRTWQQRAPMIGDYLSVSTPLIGEKNVPKPDGRVIVSLLGDDCTDLDTPIDVSYKLANERFKGIIFSRDTRVPLLGVANTLHISDRDSTDGRAKLSFLLDDEVVDHHISPELCGRLITGISAFICEKAIRLESASVKERMLTSN